MRTDGTNRSESFLTSCFQTYTVEARKGSLLVQGRVRNVENPESTYSAVSGIHLIISNVNRDALMEQVVKKYGKPAEVGPESGLGFSALYCYRWGATGSTAIRVCKDNPQAVDGVLSLELSDDGYYGRAISSYNANTGQSSVPKLR